VKLEKLKKEIINSLQLQYSIMFKITIFISSISWQVSKQNSKSVSHIYTVRHALCNFH